MKEGFASQQDKELQSNKWKKSDWSEMLDRSEEQQIVGRQSNQSSLAQPIEDQANARPRPIQHKLDQSKEQQNVGTKSNQSSLAQPVKDQAEARPQPIQQILDRSEDDQKV